MKILAVDTSSKVVSVCICEENKLLSEYNVNYKLTHSQTLMPIVKSVLESIEHNIKDIDYFAAAIGPGSFTGLRIGVGTIKGLAHGVNKGVVGVPTLDSLAYNVLTWGDIICPIMDARRNQVYNALYKVNDGNLNLLTEYRALSIEELISELNRINEKVIFVGDGIDVYREIIEENLDKKLCNFAPINLRIQRASSVACVAIEKIKENKTESYLDIKPFYIRKSQAEREYEKKKQKL